MTPRNVVDIYRLTPMQEGMLFHALEANEPGVYVEQAAYRVACSNLAAFEAAWQKVIDRHGILRTSFVWEGIEKPVQVVHQDVAAPLDVLDWRMKSTAEQEAELAEFMREQRARPFDYQVAPLMRLHLVQVSTEESMLVWTYHHILLDGWSAFRVIDEVLALYLAALAGETAGLPPATPFKDYLHWQESQDVVAAEAFWRRALDGFVAPTPLGFCERPGFSGKTNARESYVILRESLEPDLAEALRLYARRARVTLNTLFQAAWGVVLSAYSGEEEVIFGSTVSGRPADLPGTDTMVGLFINTLPTRIACTPGRPIGEWLQGIQEAQVAARRFEYCPLVQIHGWSHVPRSVPLFHTMLAVESFPASAHFTMPETQVVQQTNYAFTLVIEPAGRPRLKAMFDSQRFEEGTIQRVLRHYQNVLRALVSNETRSVEELNLSSREERALLHKWNATSLPYPTTVGVNASFEECAEQKPDAIAVVAGNQRLTYGELNRRSNQLAHDLRQRGVSPGGQVAVLLEPSLDLIVAIVAIVKAGAAYAPLDPQAPAARLETMLRGLQFTHLVSHRGLATPLAGAGMDLLDLDQAREIQCQPVDNLGYRPDTRDLLYVIHTSGSTGKPKAAGVYHHSFVNLMQWWNREFKLTADDRNLLINKATFDLAQKNIWGALMTGGELHLNPAPHFAPSEVRNLVAAEGITWINCTPSMAYSLVEETAGGQDALAPLRLLFLGGEPINKARLAPWLSRADCRTELVNTYGPTECADLCAVHRFAREEFESGQLSRPVTVGKVLPNIQLHVLDRCGRPLPPGLRGELVIGGASIGAGYLNDPVLSAQKFIPDFSKEHPGARLYRTGDISYQQEDGSFVVCGRVDFQVKVRGYRIELEEIDSALKQHSAVRDSVTVVTPDDPQRLVAYVVLAQSADDWRKALREHLAALLPYYMVPSAFVPVGALPLNDHGKVNRAAFPAPAAGDDIAPGILILPRTEIERKLADVWRAVLELDAIGVNENFFELGGHSLTITKVFSRIPKAFGVQVALGDLFAQPTIEQQARQIAALLASQAQGAAGSIPPTLHEPERPLAPSLSSAPSGGEGAVQGFKARNFIWGNSPSATEPSEIRPALRPAAIPLSASQGRMWFVHQLGNERAVDNVPNAIWFNEPLEAETVSAALTWLAARHESLRTRFVRGDDGLGRQIIDPPGSPQVRVVDVAAEAPAAQEAILAGLATTEAQGRFDLEAGPLARYVWVRIDSRRSVLLVTMHHLITDGWSMDIFTRELRAAVAAFRDSKAPMLAAPGLQFADYALWQQDWLQGDGCRKQLEYWRGRLAGSASHLALPLDEPRPAQPDYRGGVVRRLLPAETVARLKRMGEQQGATLFMTLLAAFNVLLYRLSGQNDFNIGTPIANRHRAETEGVMGPFVNTLVLRCAIEEGETFRSVLGKTRQRVLEAQDHQDLPFDRLVDALEPARHPGSHPLFQVLFSVQRAYEDTRLIDTSEWISRFDLQVVFSESEGGFRGAWEYGAALFQGATIERFAQLFERVVEAVIADIDGPIQSLPLSKPSGSDCLECTSVYPREATIAQLFAAQVAARPDAIAVTSHGEHLTYAALDRVSNALARALTSRGLQENIPVGVSLPRGADLIGAVLGILKAGGAYVPLDPEYPVERLRLMVAESGISIVITDSESAPRWREQGLEAITRAEAATSGSDFDNFVPAASRLSSAERIAYITFTSGTTGQPKGVVIPERAVIRLVANTNYCPLDDRTVMLQCAPVAFDASTFEIWGPLLNGGRVVVYPDAVLDLPALTGLIASERINTAFLTTGLFNLWTRQLEGPTGLHYLLTGGEVMSPEAVARLYQKDPIVKAVNVYGPTENTTFSTFFPVPRDFDFRRRVPIGQPIANTRLQVLDDRLQPVPTGVVGELYLGGDGLALGYWRRPEWTAQRFVADPSRPGERLYQTGNIFRRTADCQIEFLGRADQQVKIRGFRIEPEEAQAALAQHPGVRDVVVIVSEDATLGRYLAAYFVPSAPDEAPEARELRQFAARLLPRFMVPACFISVPGFPLTANGKLDRARLPAPSPEPNGAAECVAPATELERQLFSLWSKTLGSEAFGVTDDFFALGGHSLLAAQLVEQASQMASVRLPLKYFFGAPTVRDMAKYIEAARWMQDPSEAVVDEAAEEVGTLEENLHPSQPVAPQVSLGHPSAWNESDPENGATFTQPAHVTV